MIFITGDCHADFWKLGVGIFPEQKDLTKNMEKHLKFLNH